MHQGGASHQSILTVLKEECRCSSSSNSPSAAGGLGLGRSRVWRCPPSSWAQPVKPVWCARLGAAGWTSQFAGCGILVGFPSQRPRSPRAAASEALDSCRGQCPAPHGVVSSALCHALYPVSCRHLEAPLPLQEFAIFPGQHHDLPVFEHIPWGSASAPPKGRSTSIPSLTMLAMSPPWWCALRANAMISRSPAGSTCPWTAS
jgi:hypothetical protein